MDRSKTKSNNVVFGQTLRKKPSRYQQQMGLGGGGTYRGRTNHGNSSSVEVSQQQIDQHAALVAERRRQKQQLSEQVEKTFGVEIFASDNEKESSRRGWLYNVAPTTVAVSTESSSGSGAERSGLDLYFLDDTGNRTFKSTILYHPYFYAIPELPIPDQADIHLELLISTLLRLYEGRLLHVAIVHRIDLDQPNHLSPKNRHGRPVLKLMFDNVSQLMDVREQLRRVIDNNQKRRTGTHASVDAAHHRVEDILKDPLPLLVDLREYDIPYVVRVCTDLNIRAGTWYTVKTVPDDPERGGILLVDPDHESKADPVFFAFDIECTKAPLKFPNAQVDEIFMISYMVRTSTGSQGYLIVSRQVVSMDVGDFEYTPKPNYPGPFHIFNETDEKALLRRFFTEYQKHRPQIVVTYNGDFFDWPFVQARAELHGFNLYQETGVEKIGDNYSGRLCVHLDAFHWVQRDSYLPQGAQGLKAVTKYKLGYDPVEVDPEDMVRFAQEKPVHMATYSVSDAVATYYLYELYVHLFIFSLCTIIPMGPEDVLRKGSGTLCETLLVTQACNKDIICPNKQVDPAAKFHDGHLLESETYIGGKVECLESGVFRSDIEYEFNLKPAAFQELIDNIDRDLTFAIEVEGNKRKEDYANYDEVRAQIIEKLEHLRDNPKRTEKPFIYHLDVGAMYPNIILTNRLQPSAIVNDATCASCDYNQAKNGCKRTMQWIWRGDYSPATRMEYERTRDQLSRETFNNGKAFHELPEIEQASLIAGRLKKYASRAYNKTKVTDEKSMTEVVCMRENDFYVETVRQFRDRRYEYKSLKKDWTKKASASTDAASRKMCEDRILVYDSLQVAHKCILNSFYGYVMRKAARWRSMEMAGIVTKTGADIITQARTLVEQIGRPLELDTDGIWCILPHAFPDVYSFLSKDGSRMKLEYPCVMLNAACHDKFTNNQYQTLMDPEKGVYSTRQECSIFFEVDGPYRCMVIPASTEEGKLLKKRYAVFNFDGSLAELKGFELKRRGELELIKTFQSQVFERFLDGDGLKECYDSVAEIANHWLDVIDTRGESLDDDELIDLISENRSMSRQLDDYGDQKGTSQTTARRLGEFLGAEIIKDKGLNCKFIISEQPYGAPVTERAIPTAIWKTDHAMMRTYLRKWLRSPGLDGDDLDVRNILDWDYYRDRLAKTIQKIITIPATLQKVPNPVPRVGHPDWLDAKVVQMNDRFHQTSITSMFNKNPSLSSHASVDIEDLLTETKVAKLPVIHKNVRPKLPPSKDDQSSPVQERRVALSKETFNEWLARKKNLWRKSRGERLHRKGLYNGSGVREKKQRTAVSMEGYLRDNAIFLAQREWQILEVREMSIYDDNDASHSSGSFVVWAMVGKDSLQKLTLTVPRTFFLAARHELVNTSNGLLEMRKVVKHLPNRKSAAFLYEVSMPEYIFRKGQWQAYLQPMAPKDGMGDEIECIYESGTPLLSRVLARLGSVVRLQPSAQKKSSKSYSLSDLTKVEKPTDGEYLNSKLAYRRVFVYVRVDAKNDTGIVSVFFLSGGSGSCATDSNVGVDVTQPYLSKNGAFDVGAACNIWIIKPKSSQRTLSLKDCRSMFQRLLGTIHSTAGLDSEYSCIDSSSHVDVGNLKFVESEALAYAGANESISSFAKNGHGPTLIFLNSSKPAFRLRRYITSFNFSPVICMPFPPGPTHNPAISSLPALNWETPIVQLSLEAYFFMIIVSYPKRVAYARYGYVPIGNLGTDEHMALFDTGLLRLIERNSALSWASYVRGIPDHGKELVSSSGGVYTNSSSTCQVDLWDDDDVLISPVIRRPGVYRTVCAEIELQDLIIAALSDAAVTSVSLSNPNSPNSAMFFDDGQHVQKVSGPVGDEVSTSISLPILRGLAQTWIRDAFSSGSIVADELLHHIYRLVSNPQSLLFDPALHRIVHALMKTTFNRVMSELQRLGCSIIFASFQRITVATNKTELADAEEYIHFVISTARGRSEQGDVLSKLSLRPKQFHTHYVFMDEFNFGTMLLEQKPVDEVGESDLVIPGTRNDQNTVVVSSVITAWSLTNYLGSDIAQEYFRGLIGRFSKEVLRKQIELLAKESVVSIRSYALGEDDALLVYRKKQISKHFASYLTRAVDEILKDGQDELVQPPISIESSTPIYPALEFIKSVVAVLELDSSIENEVKALKRSLLSQLDVPEYSQLAQWENPCPTLILPDVFCMECQDCRDVNLCYIPPREAGVNEYQHEWCCEDCGAPYDVTDIEDRLVQLIHLKLARFQLQDSRYRKSNRVVTRALVCPDDVVLDIAEHDVLKEIRLLHSLAELHELETLQSTTSGVIASYQEAIS